MGEVVGDVTGVRDQEYQLFQLAVERGRGEEEACLGGGRLPMLVESNFKREDVEIPREFAVEDEPAVAVKQEPKSGESEGEEDGEGGEAMEE